MSQEPEYSAIRRLLLGVVVVWEKKKQKTQKVNSSVESRDPHEHRTKSVLCSSPQTSERDPVSKSAVKNARHASRSLLSCRESKIPNTHQTASVGFPMSDKLQSRSSAALCFPTDSVCPWASKICRAESFTRSTWFSFVPAFLALLPLRCLHMDYSSCTGKRRGGRRGRRRLGMPLLTLRVPRGRACMHVCARRGRAEEVRYMRRGFYGNVVRSSEEVCRES